MAKKEKVISEVRFKKPHTELKLRNGLHLTEENLTIERYEMAVSLSEDLKEFFEVKLTPKKDEVQTQE